MRAKLTVEGTELTKARLPGRCVACQDGSIVQGAAGSSHAHCWLSLRVSLVCEKQTRSMSDASIKKKYEHTVTVVAVVSKGSVVASSVSSKKDYQACL